MLEVNWPRVTEIVAYDHAAVGLLAFAEIGAKLTMDGGTIGCRAKHSRDRDAP
jgi:hypothetical protein